MIFCKRNTRIATTNRLSVFVQRSLSFVFPIDFIKISTCKNKAGLIKRIAAKDAAHGVGDQAADVAGEVGAADGDVLILNFGGQLVLQAVDVDEDAVEFFLIGFELGKAVIALALPEHIAQLYRAGNFRALAVVVVRHGCADGRGIPQLTRPFYKRMLGKVPRVFEGIPVGFGKSNTIFNIISCNFFFLNYERNFLYIPHL